MGSPFPCVTSFSLWQHSPSVRPRAVAAAFNCAYSSELTLAPMDLVCGGEAPPWDWFLFWVRTRRVASSA
jgi:hypothetical protein